MEPVKPCDFKKNINVFPVFCEGSESKVPRIIFKPKTEEEMGGCRITYQEMLLFVLRYCEGDHAQAGEICRECSMIVEMRNLYRFQSKILR
jgi:hypothetical protein